VLARVVQEHQVKAMQVVQPLAVQVAAAVAVLQQLVLLALHQVRLQQAAMVATERQTVIQVHHFITQAVVVVRHKTRQHLQEQVAQAVVVLVDKEITLLRRLLAVQTQVAAVVVHGLALIQVLAVQAL
jgi:hypothetical protein